MSVAASRLAHQAPKGWATGHGASEAQPHPLNHDAHSYTAARVGHTICYVAGLSPWRSICHLIALQVVLFLAGRVANALLGSFAATSTAVQVIINLPLLVQMLYGLVALAVIKSQNDRQAEVELRHEREELYGSEDEFDESDSET